MRQVLIGVSVCLLLSACARTPPITTTYYPAKTAMNVRVVRTLACDKQNLPVVASTATVTVSNSADFDKPWRLPFDKIDGPLANSDIKLDFYPDRRLRSINATTTGQGEAILKSAISLIASAAADVNRNELAGICKTFRQHFGDTPLTLVYSADDNFSTVPARLNLRPNAESARYHGMFRGLVGDACLHVRNKPAIHPPVSTPRGAGGYVLLNARQPAFVPVAVTVGPYGNCEASPIWSGYVAVAQHGLDYQLPIPRAAMFGKQVFAASFDEAGSISQVQYAKDTGGAGVLNVLDAAASQLNRTDTEQAAAYKAEADVIAAQQRLVKCKAAPASCS